MNYRIVATQAAKAHGLDPQLFLRQINAESGFNPNAGSGAGAIGIAQFMPATARSLGINPRDPVQALNGAAKLMSGYVKKFGSYENALRAYNAGEGAVQASRGYAETNAYVAKILHGANVGGDSAAGGAPSATPAASVTTSNVADVNAANETNRKRAIVLNLIEKHRGPNTLLATSGALAPQGVPALKSTTVKVPAGTPLRPTSTSGLSKVGGTANFEGVKVAAWIAPILKYARENGWKGKVNSGYRSFEDQTRIYNSGVRPAAKPGTSNHEGSTFPRGAVDVSDAQQLSDILRKSHYGSLLVYAGAKDPVHFSHPHNGSY